MTSVTLPAQQPLLEIVAEDLDYIVYGHVRDFRLEHLGDLGDGPLAIHKGDEASRLVAYIDALAAGWDAFMA